MQHDSRKNQKRRRSRSSHRSRSPSRKRRAYSRRGSRRNSPRHRRRSRSGSRDSRRSRRSRDRSRSRIRRREFSKSRSTSRPRSRRNSRGRRSRHGSRRNSRSSSQRRKSRSNPRASEETTKPKVEGGAEEEGPPSAAGAAVVVPKQEDSITDRQLKIELDKTSQGPPSDADDDCVLGIDDSEPVGLAAVDPKKEPTEGAESAVKEPKKEDNKLDETADGSDSDSDSSSSDSSDDEDETSNKKAESEDGEDGLIDENELYTTKAEYHSRKKGHLFCAGFPLYYRSVDLMELFKDFGAFDAKIVDRPGKSRFGFVDFITEERAELARFALNGKCPPGEQHPLFVTEKTERGSVSHWVRETEGGPRRPRRGGHRDRGSRRSGYR